MKKLKINYRDPVLKHILFWICVFLYFVLTANFNIYSGYVQVIEFNLMVVTTQIITAYFSLYVLVPKFLNKKKYFLFAVSILGLLFLMFTIYSLFKIWYYDPKYFETYNEIGKIYAQESLLIRLSNLSVFLSKAIKILTPTAIILMLQFFKNQQEFLQLKEQKNNSELTALKNQLNPHFLFNTLNNLYSLSLEKSDKTPDVIERLSNILDYILYRCKDKYVLLKKEVELIENYLELEKIRYGKRVEINFTNKKICDTKIAPLILLTFTENAFKHGIKEELNQGKIDIDLHCENDLIIFKIGNTKPNINTKSKDEKLGLQNIQKQLDLLYPNAHSLEILDKENNYSTILKLKQQNV